MARVAAPGPLHSNSRHFGTGVGTSVPLRTAAVKRKTPSELRGEQLKRNKALELVDEYPVPASGSAREAAEGTCGLKKTDSIKNPRYIDTRMDELFPVRKNSVRLKLLCRKGNAEKNGPIQSTGNLKNSYAPSDLYGENQPQVSRPEGSFVSTAARKDGTIKADNSTEKCIGNTFVSVTELSQSSDKLSGLETVDMDKALKGLVAHEPPIVSAAASVHCDSAPATFCSDFRVPDGHIPLDFTLKTTMRILSSSSVSWFHRLVNSSSFSGVVQFTPLTGCYEDNTGLFKRNSLAPIYNAKGLHSWVYPQSLLPSAAISALVAAGGGEMDFLSKRQLAWEDSFRSLYYMLRKNICNIFYICTSQFVVMFTGHRGSKDTKCACNAYISRSTRGLRSTLKEQDVSFSMPLCHSKVEQVTTEDLVELLEIEKHNLGQTRRVGSICAVDNSPQSLLAFSGIENIHSLYDFLLNYRYLLSSLSGVDVPVLYAPVPFENASLSAPEVRCKEVRRVDQVSLSMKESNIKDVAHLDSSAGFCYSIEIKGAYLPPWIISSVCDALGKNGISFEASFVNDPTSIGLNVGLDAISKKSNSEAKAVEEAVEGDGLEESVHRSVIPCTTYSPQLCSAFLKGLKFSDGSYLASLSPG